MTDLSTRVAALAGRSDNALDVLIEIAMFSNPDGPFTAVRANSAGTKVIYTDRAGNDVTCWAENWTAEHRAWHTIEALKARGL